MRQGPNAILQTADEGLLLWTCLLYTSRLLKLPENIQEKLANGQISPGHGRALLAAKDKAYQEKLCNRIINEGLSVRKTEELANHFKSNKAVKTKETKDVNILQVERDLKEIYGTKISITNKGKKGVLKIEYYGEDELNRLIELLKICLLYTSQTVDL